MADEDWKRLAGAYRDHVLAPPVVDADPEVVRGRETARMAVGSFYTGGRRPSLAFFLIMERWVNKTMTFEQALAEIKELDKLETPPPVTPEEKWVAGLIDGDELPAEMKKRGDD